MKFLLILLAIVSACPGNPAAEDSAPLGRHLARMHVPSFEITGPVEVETSASTPATMRVSVPVRWLAAMPADPGALKITIACESYDADPLPGTRLSNREPLTSGHEFVLSGSVAHPGPDSIGSCRIVRAFARARSAWDPAGEEYYFGWRAPIDEQIPVWVVPGAPETAPRWHFWEEPFGGPQ